MSDRAEALGRGLAQGGSLGWSDEAMAKLLSSMPKPAEDGGIPRTYAAGSEEKDLLNSERGANADAQAKFPINYGAGQFLGGTPLASLAPVVGGGVAGAGLAGGALGAAMGAGGAAEGSRLSGAANGAGLGAIRAMGGAIAPRALEAIKGFRLPPGGGAAPALAGEGPVNIPAPEEVPGIQITRSQQELPFPGRGGSAKAPVLESSLENAPTSDNQLPLNFERGNAIRPNRFPSGMHDLGDMPQIPKPGNPGFRPSEVPQALDVADAADNLTSAANKRLVERSYAAAAKRGAPVDVELERAKQLADSATSRMDTGAGFKRRR